MRISLFFNRLGIFLITKPVLFLVHAEASSPLHKSVSGLELSKAECGGGNAGKGRRSSGKPWTACLAETIGQTFASANTFVVSHSSAVATSDQTHPSLSISFSGLSSSYSGRKAIWCQGLLWALGIRTQKLGIGAQLWWKIHCECFIQ